MASKTWQILDVDRAAYLSTGPGKTEVLTLPGVDGLEVAKYTMAGGLSDGVDVLRVTNGNVSFRLLPTRGMSVWDAHRGETRFGWQSPVRGPVHPKFVDLGEPSGLGWLDGFNELLVRCGLESNGAPEFDAAGRLKYPLHGRIANRPAHQVEVTIDGDAHEITVVGAVEETRFLFSNLRLTSTFKMKAGETGFRIHDEVQNLSARSAEIQLLYHVNFGSPLLDAGAKMIAPVKTIVPRNGTSADSIKTWDSYEAPQPGFEEQVYFFELLADQDNRTRVLLRNAEGTAGASLQFNKQQFPYFILWKNTASLADGYVTGLEPATNFPNPRSYEGEQGRVVKLPPGGRVEFESQLTFHDTAGVMETEEAIAAIQGAVRPQILDEPQSGWVKLAD